MVRVMLGAMLKQCSAMANTKERKILTCLETEEGAVDCCGLLWIKSGRPMKQGSRNSVADLGTPTDLAIAASVVAFALAAFWWGKL